MLDFYKDGKHYRVAGVTVYNMVLLRYGNCLTNKDFLRQKIPMYFRQLTPFFLSEYLIISYVQYTVNTAIVITSLIR